MASKKTLKQILDASDKCILVPCVYDCASNHAVEMCGFPISLLSGGELSLAMNGAIDYGFTGLTDLDPKHNGGIEAEEFGNYQWPAMMATFNKPGDFEITATFTSASGHQASVVKSLKVV